MGYWGFRIRRSATSTNPSSKRDRTRTHQRKGTKVKKIILIAGLLLFSTKLVFAAPTHFRTDGGSPLQCNGLVDAPLNRNGQCSVNATNIRIKSTSLTNDLVVDYGEFEIIVKPAVRQRYK